MSALRWRRASWVLALILVAETAIRAAWTLNTCLAGHCSPLRFTTLRVRNTRYLNLYRADASVGYVPREGAHVAMTDALDTHGDWGWERGADIRISDESFRSNGNALAPKAAHKILAVGDSFTFGYQVDNRQTWPSCLERALHVGVDNARAPAYGFGQTMQRAL